MSQTSFLNLQPDPCARKHGGDRESAEAFRSVNRETQRELIYDTLMILSDRLSGATLDEIAAYLDLAPNQISGRITELHLASRIAWNGQRRLTRTGCPAKVWMPTA
jgi:hypothetical protein